MKKILSLIFIIMLMLGLVACENVDDPVDKEQPSQQDPEKDPDEDDPDEDDPEDDPDEPTVKLEFKTKEYTVGIGEEIVIDLDTDIEDKTKISYKNSDNKVVAFQKNGNLKALKSGTATITAKFGEVTATMTITVTDEVKVFEKTDYRYWLNEISKKEDVNTLLMSDAEIEKFNNAVYDNPTESRVKDLSKVEISVSAATVKALIESYTKITKYTMYTQGGQTVSQTQKNEILNNRNLDSLTGTITAKYGIVVTFSDLKAYPTTNYLSTKNYDYNQENGLVAAEGVIIYCYSKDAKWAFVQAENYYGWISVDAIAECSKADFLKFYRAENYLVVIGERTTIDETVYRMGDKLPLISASETEYKVLNPKKCGDGTLCINEVTVTPNENVNNGYLDYTIGNVIKQGFKLVGTPYRWGDYNIDGRDCSSTQNAIYHCFGFVMPRNTSNQKAIPGYSTVVNGLNDTSMRTYKVGTLIFTSTHVMMYIGEDADGNSYLLHNSGSCKLQTLASYNAASGKNMIGTLTIR